MSARNKGFRMEVEFPDKQTKDRVRLGLKGIAFDLDITNGYHRTGYIPGFLELVLECRDDIMPILEAAIKEKESEIHAE